jgi:hypothetical protein
MPELVLLIFVIVSMANVETIISSWTGNALFLFAALGNWALILFVAKKSLDRSLWKHAAQGAQSTSGRFYGVGPPTWGSQTGLGVLTRGILKRKRAMRIKYGPGWGYKAPGVLVTFRGSRRFPRK